MAAVSNSALQRSGARAPSPTRGPSSAAQKQAKRREMAQQQQQQQQQQAGDGPEESRQVEVGGAVGNQTSRPNFEAGPSAQAEVNEADSTSGHTDALEAIKLAREAMHIVSPGQGSGGEVHGAGAGAGAGPASQPVTAEEEAEIFAAVVGQQEEEQAAAAYETGLPPSVRKGGVAAAATSLEEEEQSPLTDDAGGDLLSMPPTVLAPSSSTMGGATLPLQSAGKSADGGGGADGMVFDPLDPTRSLLSGGSADDVGGQSDSSLSSFGHRQGAKGSNRFKGAAMKVKLTNSFTQQVRSSDDTRFGSDHQDDPSKADRARPTLKSVGQTVLLEIERKQWLARKWQGDIDKQRESVKDAMEKARHEKTSDMSVAMDKLRNIMNPLSPSPDQRLRLEDKADGLLSRIKDQLAAAATGSAQDQDEMYDLNGDDDGDEDGDEYHSSHRRHGGQGSGNEDSHQKFAGRGKELISRILSKDNHHQQRDSEGGEGIEGSNYSLHDGDDDYDDDVDGGEDDGEGGGQDGEGGHGLSSGSHGQDATVPARQLEWQGAMTVERLADDAEELATTRGLSGQRPNFSSLCAVLVVDGYGNVASNGWEEKFISLSDAKLWSAAYFTVAGGTISTAGAAGRFNCVADLASCGVSVVFEESSHTATGFAIVIRTLSAFTIKIAPKRFKALLEWGAVLHQAINELPTLISPPSPHLPSSSSDWAGPFPASPTHAAFLRSGFTGTGGLEYSPTSSPSAGAQGQLFGAEPTASEFFSQGAIGRGSSSVGRSRLKTQQPAGFNPTQQGPQGGGPQGGVPAESWVDTYRRQQRERRSSGGPSP